MVICIFGESCTGKSTLAEAIVEQRKATIYTGKDYLRMAKNEEEAKQKFRQLLEDSCGKEGLVLYVATEKELLQFLPEGSLRILVTADLETIKERFAKRTGGHLPAPLGVMLERKHGMFDSEPHDLQVNGEELTESVKKVLSLIQSK